MAKNPFETIFQQAKNGMGDTGPQAGIATVGAVYTNGVTLIFPGTTAATSKRYKKNRDLTVSAGDTVVIVKISGTYVVLCRI